MYDLDIENIKILEHVYFEDLINLGFRKIKYLDEGSNKIAYSGIKDGKKVAIKVMDYYEGIGQRGIQQKMIRLFKNKIPPFLCMNEYIPSIIRATEAKELLLIKYNSFVDNEVWFYLDYLINKNNKPAFYYEISEFYDMELDAFFYNQKWSWEDFKNIFCQIIMGIKFLQSKGISFMDLKLNNLMITKETKKIHFIDYYDSPYKCNYLDCKNYNNYSYTYYDIFNNKFSFYQDIWRIGFMMLVIIEKRNNNLSTSLSELYRQTKKMKKNCSSYLFCNENQIKTNSQEYLNDYMEKLQAFLNKDRKLSNQDKVNLYNLLYSSIHSNIETPYSLDDMLNNPFFSDCKETTENFFKNF